MVTEKDHVENMRNRLLAKKAELETAAREIQEMIDALSKVPRILSGASPVTRSSPAVERSTKPAARTANLGGLVEKYIAEEIKYDEGIKIGEMIDWLQKEHGVQTKKKSLYAYTHSLLKKKAAAGKLHYTEGVGFYKTRGEDKHSQLVATA
jgi:hypothetical protein